jgi:TrpR family transcriptional regulator, trp operon repressor
MTNDSEIITSNISEMANALSKADPSLIEDFFVCLLTPSEMDEIAKRWALVKEIATGRPQREIAKDLGLSLCKITRGSRELKKESSAFKSMLILAGFEVPDVITRRRAPRHEDAGAEAGKSTAASPS